MIAEGGKEVKAEFKNDSSLLHVGAEGHTGPSHGVQRVGVTRRKKQAGDLKALLEGLDLR